MLGWMMGFPPPEEKLIRQPETDYFSFPKLRWTVCHIRVFHNDHGVFAARGVHGQTTYIDPTAEMVIVRFCIVSHG